MKRSFIASVPAALMLLSALSFAGASPAFARTGETFATEITKRINPDMDEFVFRLESYEGEYELCYTKTISIFDAKTGNLLQTLVTSEFNDGDDAHAFSREEVELIVEDMNFDGYDDIRIAAFTTAGPNIPYICWLWDKNTKQFVHDADLSAIASFEIDKDNEWIHASNRVSAISWRTEFYRWTDGRLTLFRAMDANLDEDDTEEIVTWELKGGELVETGRTKEKSE